MVGSDARWIPLESNPKVFDFWAYASGLAKNGTHFEDVYGLDEDLLAMVSPNVEAISLCFPIRGETKDKDTQEDSMIKESNLHPVDPTIFWIKQTIPNACGTMSLIHALANSDVTLAPNSPLARFIDECRDMTPLGRAKCLETTHLFDDIHQDAAKSGQTNAENANMDTDLHFTTFVRAPPASVRAAAGAVAKGQIEVQGVGASGLGAEGEGSTEMRLVELDGRRAGPIDRGECTDLLRDAAKHIRNLMNQQHGGIEFGMLALCVPPDEDKAELTKR